MMSLTTVYRILMMMLLVSVMQSQADEQAPSCQESGGKCVLTQANECAKPIDAPGCASDETCCSGEQCPTISLCKNTGGTCVPSSEATKDVCPNPPQGLCPSGCLCCPGEA